MALPDIPLDPSELSQIRSITSDFFYEKCDSNVFLLMDPGNMRSVVTKCRRVLGKIDRAIITAVIKEEYGISKVRIKQGKWTEDEENILLRNAREYLQEHESTMDVAFNLPRKERSEFYKAMARDIQRPFLITLHKIHRFLDPKNHIGRYTEAEVRLLRRLERKYRDDPKKWKKIGDEMGRSNESVRDRFTKIGLQQSTQAGHWSTDEVTKLRHLITKHGPSWDVVAKELNTKTKFQCLRKYYSLKRRDEFAEESKEFTSEHSIKLVSAISTTAANYIEDINWTSIQRKMPEISRERLKREFIGLVRLHMPFSNSYNLNDVTEVLMNVLTSSIKTPPEPSLSATSNQCVDLSE